MPYWVQMEEYEILERRGNAIYKTRKVRAVWFRNDQAPAPYVADPHNRYWCNTTNLHFGPNKPKDP